MWEFVRIGLQAFVYL